jgi:hypothetical protein
MSFSVQVHLGFGSKVSSKAWRLGVDIVAYHFRTGAGYQVAGLTKMGFMGLQLDQGLHGPIWLLGE